MNNVDVVRAWKDEEYRLSLSDAERAQLPAHPAGLVELQDAELDQAAGGTVWVTCTNSVFFCNAVTSKKTLDLICFSNHFVSNRF